MHAYRARSLVRSAGRPVCHEGLIPHRLCTHLSFVFFLAVPLKTVLPASTSLTSTTNPYIYYYMRISSLSPLLIRTPAPCVSIEYPLSMTMRFHSSLHPPACTSLRPERGSRFADAVEPVRRDRARECEWGRARGRPCSVRSLPITVSLNSSQEHCH